MGNITLQEDGCPCAIYLILWNNEKMTLHEIYDYLKPLFAETSIRRSLYGLRDAGVVYKKGSNTWHFDKSKKSIKIIEK